MSRSLLSSIAILLVLAALPADAQTSITCTTGGGLTCSPNPITGTGSIAVAAPLSIANGGTGSSSFTSGSVPFYNGTTLAQDNANLSWNSTAKLLVTPVSDLGGQVFNVKAYGAKGDGTTDDTSSIQSAINAAGAGRVYLPPGTYKVSSALTLSSAGSSLAGAGVGATVISTSSTTADVLDLGTTGTSSHPGVAVRDLSITTSVTRTAGDAIRLLNDEQFTIDNLRIVVSGNGIDATQPTGGDSAIIYVTRVEIEITGPFSAFILNGAGEVHLAHAWLRGPVANGGTVTGSVGIDIQNGGMFVNHVETVQFEKGVYIHPGSTQNSEWSVFDDVLADTNSLYGFHVAGSGTVLGQVFLNCWAGSNGTIGTYKSINGTGFRIENGDGILLSGARVINNGGNGVDLYSGAKNVEIGGGIFAGNSQDSSAIAQGIVVRANTQRFRIHDVRAGQSVGETAADPQAYGIDILSGCDNYIVTGNDTTGNTTGGLNNTPGTAATRIVANNL